MTIDQSGSRRIVEIIRDVIGGSAEPITIVLRKSLNEESLHELMSLKQVVSVVLQGPNESFATHYPGRIGWYQPNETGWTMPVLLAKEIFYIGNLSNFGFRAAWSAWRAGIRSFRSSDPSGSLDKSAMLAEVIRAVIRALAHRMPAQITGLLYQLRSKRIVKHLSKLKVPAYQPEQGCILFASGSLGPGGSERQIVNTLLGLKSKGYNNLKFLHEQPMQYPYDFYLSNIQNAGIQISQLIPLEARNIDDWGIDSIWSELYQQIFLLGPIGNQIAAYALEFQEKRPELVHTWLDHINVTAGIAAAIIGVPRIVISCRSLAPTHFDFYQPYMKALYQLLTQFPNVTILNNSKSGARDYERWLSLPRSTLRVIHNGFDFSRFPAGKEVERVREQYLLSIGIPQNACVIGSVMRISEEKQPLLWLKMAEYVARQYPNAYFLIVGDGVMGEEMKSAAVSLGLSKKTRFVGHEKNALSAIAAMDVFVQTSRVEGLPNVLIEAQALGVPVVATNVGGTRETFVDGMTGSLVNTQTPEDIANKVMEILGNLELRTQMKKLASSKAKDEFSLEKMITRTMDVYAN